MDESHPVHPSVLVKSEVKNTGTKPHRPDGNVTETDRAVAGLPTGGSYRAITLAVVMMGVTMSAVDTTAVVLGLPVMINDLRSDIVSMIWVIIAYLLVITILGTQVGRLGDTYGRVRMYNLGFAIFTLASLLCGISSTGVELILFRVLQGLGGALITSNSGAIIADTFGESERGRAFGFTGIGWSAGAVLGILVGGALATFLSWRYIFFINLPVGVVATIIGYVKLKERSPRIRRRIDILGMGLLGTGLLLALYALVEMTGFGITATYSTILAAGALAVAGFVFWERRSAEPLLESVDSPRKSAHGLDASRLISVPCQLRCTLSRDNVSSRSEGDVSVRRVSSPSTGLRARRIRRPNRRKALRQVGSKSDSLAGPNHSGRWLLHLLHLGHEHPSSAGSPRSVLTGLGSSTFFPANNSAVMSAAPPRAYGIASGLLRTLSNIGMVCSFAVALLIASLSIPRQLAFAIFLGIGGISSQLSAAFVDGMHSAFTASISLLAVALLLSVLRGREKRTIQNRASNGS